MGGDNNNHNEEDAILLIQQYSELLSKQEHLINTKQHYGNNDNKEKRICTINTRSNSELVIKWNTHTILDSCLITLADTLHQGNKMIQLAQSHYNFVIFYGQYFLQSKKSPEDCIADQMENIVALTSFVKKVQQVSVHIFRQMQAMNYNTFEIKTIRMDYLVSQLGDLLAVLATLDCLVNSSSLSNHWNGYRKSVKSLNNASNRFKKLNSILDLIEERIMTDKIFENCLDLIHSDMHSSKSTIKRLTDDDTISSYLKLKINELDRSGIEFYESASVKVWIKVNALFVLHNTVFTIDKKMFNMLTDVNIKAHSVCISGRVLWYPEQFLYRHASILCSSMKKMSETYLRARQAYIATKKLNLPKEVVIAQLHSSKWAIKMNEAFSLGNAHLNSTQMSQRMMLLFQGIRFASQINFIVRTVSGIHITLGIPMTKSCLLAICKLIEVLKAMYDCFSKNLTKISSSINLISQHLSFQLASEIAHLKRNIITSKNYSKQVDELTALVIAEQAFKSPSSKFRDIVANISLSIVSVKTSNDEKWTKIWNLLENLENITNFETKMKEMCECSFLYWNKEIIPIYFKQVFCAKKDFSKLSLFFGAINDCYVTLKALKAQNVLATIFFEDINSYFGECILNPLNQQIETILRLQTHSHLQLETSNPFSVPVSSNRSLLKVPFFKLANDYISISYSVEHYLSYTFYNLTTVVLHDWKTYGQMRQLVNFKYDIHTVEDNLPTQTLEQGLDVLEIMRNIQVFVSKFSYNLNNQIFIEDNSNNKQLNTLNIRHVANSIRTHGIGIMNTTVNFTYQFLRKKFHMFSQFMYDEQIKARLIKDVRHFREAANDSKKYSFKRAEKFNRGICNLGLNEDGQSYLDLFRILITHIGNTMGYVRMVRSGGLHCCANATAFLPSLKSTQISDESITESFQENQVLKQAYDILQNTIESLTSNFSHGTDYFKLLVDVFTPAFRNDGNMHLKTFYIIVPPLTVNFVEHMLLGKDKMNKKNKTGASFTDDGFAMGLAFILKLLDQDEDIDSLHWFQSVTDYIAQERKSLELQLSTGSIQLQQALALTDKKLTLLEEEFQLLYFSFSSARIFFQ